MEPDLKHYRSDSFAEAMAQDLKRHRRPHPLDEKRNGARPKRRREPSDPERGTQRQGIGGVAIFRKRGSSDMSGP